MISYTSLLITSPLMILQSFLEATPWSWVWVGALSMVLIADGVQGLSLRRNQLWPPGGSWFVLSIVFIKLIMLSLLSSPMFIPDMTSESLTEYNINPAKFVYIVFLFTMLSLSLPSLRDMNNMKKYFGVLIFCITFLLLIQACSQMSDIPSFVVIFIIFILLWPSSFALAVPAIGSTYSEQLQKSPSNVFIVVTELSASSPVFSACGVYLAFLSLYEFVSFYSSGFRPIIIAPLLEYTLPILCGTVIGIIMLIFRCFGATILSKRCSLNQLLHVFKVGKNWTEMPQEQNHHAVNSHVLAQPNRLKKILLAVKNILLDLHIGYLLTTVVICQISSLIPLCFVILMLREHAHQSD